MSISNCAPNKIPLDLYNGISSAAPNNRQWAIYKPIPNSSLKTCIGYYSSQSEATLAASHLLDPNIEIVEVLRCTTL